GRCSTRARDVGIVLPCRGLAAAASADRYPDCRLHDLRGTALSLLQRLAGSSALARDEFLRTHAAGTGLQSRQGLGASPCKGLYGAPPSHQYGARYRAQAETDLLLA